MLKMIWEGVWLLSLGILDAKYRRVPLWLIGTGLPAVLMVIKRPETGEAVIWLLAALIPGVILLLLAAAKKAGVGDGLVLLVLGLAGEAMDILQIFLLSLLLMSLLAAGLMAWRKADRKTRLPYLPFLFLAWVVWMAAG